MYAEIQEALVKRLATKNNPKLLARKLNIGEALRQIKTLEKLPKREILEKTGIKRSALNAIMFERECNTSFDKLMNLTKALNIGLDELIAVARETARYNFYLLRRNEIAKLPINEEICDVMTFSPPIFNRRDFMWALIRILPGKSIINCQHPHIKEVGCFVTNGHLRLRYGASEQPVHSNEVIFFDPRIPHEFINAESNFTTDFFLLYHLTPHIEVKPQRGRKAAVAPFDTARLIETIREEMSPAPDNLVSCNTLAQLSGVDYDSIAYLLYRKPKILFLEKIDALCVLSRLPFERLIQKAENRYQGWFKIHGENDKAVMDYRLNYGMKINTHTTPGTGARSFGFADINFDAIEDIRKRHSWTFTDSSFLGIRVEKGVLGIQYGRQPEQKLYWGDTVYLNADIPVTLFNALTVDEAKEQKESPEVKALTFSHPALV